MSQTFIKNQEDFTCEHCGAKVAGDGYTNHCPVCLWSKHVDDHPGDRAATCQGLMSPIGYVAARGNYTLIHQCQRCGARKPNKMSPSDDLAHLANLC